MITIPCVCLFTHEKLACCVGQRLPNEKQAGFCENIQPPGLCVLESKRRHKEKVTLTCLVATNQPKNSTASFLRRGKKDMKSHPNLNIILKIFILVLFLWVVCRSYILTFEMNHV